MARYRAVAELCTGSAETGVVEGAGAGDGEVVIDEHAAVTNAAVTASAWSERLAVMCSPRRASSPDPV